MLCTIRIDCFHFANDLMVLVPPKPPVIRVHRLTSNSINLLTNGDIGNLSIIAYRIKYKITYREWTEKLVRASVVLLRLKIIQKNMISKIYEVNKTILIR